MRILVDIRHLAHPKPSGVGEYTIEILRALFRIDKQNQYTLLSTGRIKPDIDVLFPGHTQDVEHVHVSIPNKILNLRMSLLGHPTLNWHVKNPVDLLFMPNLNIAPLPPNLPTVLTVHDLSWKIFPEFYSARMRAWHKAIKPQALIDRVDSIITPSLSTKCDLERSFGRKSDRVHVIPHGVHSRYSASMQARDHGVRSRQKLPKRFVLFLGTIEPRKNIIAIIDGVKRYRDQTGDDLHLVLVGKWGWKARAIKKRLWKRDTKPWVHQLGYVPKEDLPAVYRSAKALVWPSIYEGFGLPVLESMACGTPVITSHTSSLAEVTGDAAVHVDPFNDQDITSALMGILGSNTLHTTLAQKGQKQAANHTWQQAAEQTLCVFHKTQEKS